MVAATRRLCERSASIPALRSAKPRAANPVVFPHATFILPADTDSPPSIAASARTATAGPGADRQRHAGRAAGVFTQNRDLRRSGRVCRERLPADAGRGVVVCAGNANACTGERGSPMPAT